MGLFDKFKAYLAEEEPEEKEAEQTELEQTELEKIDSEQEMTEQEDVGKKGNSFFGKLFGRKKEKTENTEDVPEGVSKEAKSVMNATSLKASEAKAVQDFWEQLVDVSTHMNEISREYALVAR